MSYEHSLLLVYGDAMLYLGILPDLCILADRLVFPYIRFGHINILRVSDIKGIGGILIVIGKWNAIRHVR
jgi:hypothetical protein